MSTERLTEEAGRLAKRGVKELILVAQETTLYGVDLYGEKRLPALLRALSEIDGIEWIRLLYCYPEEIDDALIEAIAKEKKVLHYLDLPIQHGADSVLRRMGRYTDRRSVLRIVSKLREKIPDVCLRTTLISGFPGETEKEHEESVSLVREVGFDRLGVFPYSKEEGTPAAKLRGQLRKRIKEERRDILMRTQQEIAFRKTAALKGKTLDALIEGKLADEEHVYVGRTYRDAPDVDGYIFVRSDRELLTGDIVRTRVLAAKDYDLIGKEFARP